jgi:hypothetical protein
MMLLTLARTLMSPPRLVPLEAVVAAGAAVAVAVVGAVAAAVEVITHPPLHLLYLLYFSQPLHLHRP